MTAEIITINDVRRTGHCVRGIKRWFEGHNLDFDRFLRRGVEAETLLATGDALAIQVVTAVRERRSSDG